MPETEEEKRFENYLKENLRIQITVNKSDFHTTDGSTATSFVVSLLLKDEEISCDSYYS